MDDEKQQSELYSLIRTEVELDLFDQRTYCNGVCEKLHGQTRYTFSRLQSSSAAGMRSKPFQDCLLQLKDELHDFNCFAYPLWGIDSHSVFH